MPRPLVFGNGKLLVQVDRRGRMRDLFWPLEKGLNHLNGSFCRIGLHWHGRFTWLDSDDWGIEQSYQGSTNVGLEIYISNHFPFRISVQSEVVGKETFSRTIQIASELPHDADLRLFFTHDFSIDESSVGDTVFYHPGSRSVIHYKRSTVLAFGANARGEAIHSVACGLKRVDGLEGTWRDAEDGELVSKPIEQGSVDSTFRIELKLLTSEPAEVRYWLVAATTIEAATDLAIQAQQPRIGSHVTEEATEPSAVESLPQRHRELFSRSIQIVKALCAENGAILAAADSDIMERNLAHYAYVWPRDGALIARLLDRVGEADRSRKFFDFCAPLISAAQPFFLQKYCPDGTLGATWHPWIVNGQPDIPRQIDETALVLWSYCHHIRETGDLNHFDLSFLSFFKPMADFLAGFKDGESYDLWEERRGVHTFSCTAVVAALRSAAELVTSTLGAELAEPYSIAANEVRAQIMERALDRETGALKPTLDSKANHIVDSSTLLALLICPFDEQTTRATVNAVESRLTSGGGIARYEGDWYARRYTSGPGNPWVICTMWLARLKISLADSIDELDGALACLDWVHSKSEATGVLAEQYDPEISEPLSVSPLNWSHAEYATACLDWGERFQSLTSTNQ